MLRKLRKRVRAVFVLAGVPVAALALEAAPAQAAEPYTTYDADGVFLVEGRRVFPIGVSMPPPLGGVTPWETDAVDELVAGGVTLFRTGPSGRDWTDELLIQAEAWADAAAAHGVLTWVNLRELNLALPGSEHEERLIQVVETLKDHPGFGFWKGSDEPWPRHPPEELAHAHATVKAIDPNHVYHTIFGPFSEDGSILRRPPKPPDLTPYNIVTDTHGTNLYPIYYKLQRGPKLHMVGRWMAALQSATSRNALTMTLQICFKGSKSLVTDDYILPTKAQERYMAYDAIVNGARGLLFFGGELARCQNEADRALGWNWTFWRDVLQPLLAEVGVRSPLHEALLRPETTVKLRTNGLAAAAVSREVGDDLWVIATRNGSIPGRVTIRDLPAWATTGTRFPGGGSVTPENGRLTLTFPSWGVRVFRFSR